MKSFSSLRPATLFAATFFLGSLSAATNPSWVAAAELSVSIDGVFCPAESWAGGDPRAVVGAGKQVGGVQIAPLTLEYALPLPAPVQNWVSSFCAGQSTAHQIVLTEFTASQANGGPGIQLSNAVLTEVSFGPFNATAKSSSRVTLVIQPGAWQKATMAGPPPQRNRGHSSGNFRLQVAGLDGQWTKQIDRFTIRQSAGGSIDYPNLVITLPVAHATDWLAWRDATLGLSGTGGGGSQKKTGSLEYLDAVLHPIAFALHLEGLQIIRATRVVVEAQGGDIVQAELLCDRITVTAAAAASPAAATTPATTNPPAAPTPAADSDKKEVATSDTDKGVRDPADFPRPDGMVRQSFVANVSDAQVREYATYNSKYDYDKLVASYDTLVKAAGWDAAYRTESGKTAEDRMIIIEWHKDKNLVAEVRVYVAKEGSTASVTITNYNPSNKK